MQIRACIITLLSLVASSLLSLEAQVVDYGSNNGVFSFEDDCSAITTNKGSKTAISDSHSKLGKRSLEWSWKKQGASLSLKAPVPYLPENPDPKETSVSSFVFWIYSPEKIDGTLRFSFRKDGKECCHFTYTLGFEGWRGAWVGFDRDMEGNPEIGMNEIVISAPEDIRKGKLYFDGIITASFQDVRYHTADWQARFINPHTTSFWLTLNQFWDNRLDIELSDKITDNEISDLKTIEDRFITLVTDNIQPLSIEEIRQTYGSYAITRNADGTIKGKPIWFIRYGETYLNQGIPDAMQSFTAHGQTLKQLNDFMFKTAVSYLHETDPAIRKEIAEIYISLTRHLLDQGFAAGSGQGTLHHLGYSMRNFYTGPVIMKEILKAEGLDDDMQRAMEWFCGVGEVKTAPKELGMDVDAFNTSMMGRFASIIMLEDTPYKQAYMKALSRWVDNGFKYTEGLRPCFKRDGCVVHHRKCYPEYATGGFRGSINAIWMLAKTAFSVSEESHEIQKHALLQMRFFSNLKSFPLAMSGRHPDGTRALIPSQFALLADAGSPDGREETDTELAAAYLRLNGESGKWAEKFISKGIKAEKAPAGGHNFAYNCSLSYRQDNWLVTFAGHSRYLWAAETYRNENHYGRYLTHGSMQILGSDSFESGFMMDGWDWCHIPGTTAAEIPMDQMKANVLNVDEHSGYEEMLLSDEWFASGVSFGKEAAAYSMILHEHDKYNGSLRAHKTFFAFGNRIVCLGSDLENRLEGSQLHTTLFQNSIRQDSHATITNGTSHNSTSYTECLEGGSNLIIDRLGNAFLVKDSEVIVKRGLQHSLHEETDRPTEGLFEKAYINHGTVCGNGTSDRKNSYEYLVIVQADSIQTAKYQEQLPYNVERCDSTAHIVTDTESGIKAAAAFETISIDGLIEEVSPSILMYRQTGNLLQMSICNPDLALYEGEADEIFDSEGKRKERSVYGRTWIENPAATTQIRMTLNGEWVAEGTDNSRISISISEGKTHITLTTCESKTEQMTLKTR